MSDCSQCACRRKDGFCTIRKERCSYCHAPRACPDWMGRVGESLHNHIRSWWRSMQDLSTSRKRFAFATRKATRWEVYQTCSRKRRFRDFDEAMAMATHLNRHKGLVLHAYECPFCGGYHLTSQTRTVAAAAARLEVPLVEVA